MSNGNALMPKADPKFSQLRGMIESYAPQIQKTLPKHITADRMIRICLTAITKTPKLQQCDPKTVILSMMNASQLGVEPDGRNGHLIPYWNGRRKLFECQFQVDYKGLVNLIYRNSNVESVQAFAVHEKDFFDFSLGSESFIKHRPDMSENPGPLIAAWAMVKFKNGSSVFRVMSRADVLKRRDISQSWNAKGGPSGPWVDWEEEMWAKTALKNLSKWAPLGEDVENLVEQENRMEAGENILDVPIITDDEEEPEEAPPVDKSTEMAQQLRKKRKPGRPKGSKNKPHPEPELEPHPEPELVAEPEAIPISDLPVGSLQVSREEAMAIIRSATDQSAMPAFMQSAGASSLEQLNEDQLGELMLAMGI